MVPFSYGELVCAKSSGQALLYSECVRVKAWPSCAPSATHTRFGTIIHLVLNDYFREGGPIIW